VKFSENNDSIQHLVGGRFGYFDFALWVGLCVWDKSKCAKCGLAEFQIFLCGGQKIKTRSGRLSCRQKVCPLVGIYSCIFDVVRSSLMVVVSVFTLATNEYINAYNPIFLVSIASISHISATLLGRIKFSVRPLPNLDKVSLKSNYSHNLYYS